MQDPKSLACRDQQRNTSRHKQWLCRTHKKTQGVTTQLQQEQALTRDQVLCRTHKRTQGVTTQSRQEQALRTHRPSSIGPDGGPAVVMSLSVPCFFGRGLKGECVMNKRDLTQLAASNDTASSQQWRHIPRTDYSVQTQTYLLSADGPASSNRSRFPVARAADIDEMDKLRNAINEGEIKLESR